MQGPAIRHGKPVAEPGQEISITSQPPRRRGAANREDAEVDVLPARGDLATEEEPVLAGRGVEVEAPDGVAEVGAPGERNAGTWVHCLVTGLQTM